MKMRLMGWMTVAAGLCLSLLAETPAWAQGKTAYTMQVNNNPDTFALLTFDTANPAILLASVPITGVRAGEALVDLDIRPATGHLYALGVEPVSNTMTLYLLSPQTGVATPVGSGGFGGAGDLPSLGDGYFGIDFDPVADQLRVTTTISQSVSLSPKNFRINPNTGALIQADTDLGAIFQEGAAYTNNGLGSTVTTLYTIGQNTLYIQTPPNSGAQTQGVALSPALSFITGFDLDEDAVTSASGTPVNAGSSEAYVIGDGGLLRVNLLTGEVRPRIAIGNDISAFFRGLAVQPYEPGELPAYALKANGQSLLRFSTTSPGAVTEAIINPAGIVAGDVLSAIDFRPQTGQLYALGSNQVNNTVRLYLVEPWTNDGGTTAAVTALGAPIAVTAGANAFGFDFNPTVDRIRVITNAGDNFRINPNTGALAGTDAPINPAGTSVTAAAYTNSFGQDLGAGLPTTLYTLDTAGFGGIAIQNPPNGGTQTQFRLITAGGPPLGFTGINGFDIPGFVQTQTPNAAATGSAYAVFNRGPNATTLARIDLTTGIASGAGAVGNGSIELSGLALGENFSRLVATTTTLVVTPMHAPFGEPVTLRATVTPADATGFITFFKDGQLLSTAPLIGNQATYTFPTLPVGSYQLSAHYGGTSSHAVSDAPSTLTVGQFRQHFAEGATGTFFETEIGLMNASTTQTAHVTVRVFAEGAPEIPMEFMMPPLSRRSLFLDTILSVINFAGGVSTLIESDQPIAATRQMTWGSPVYGSTLESGVPDTSTAWYFAEGATSPYSLYYLIENPGATEAQVTFRHLLEGGAAPIEWSDTVAPHARRTFYINDVPGAGNASLSTTIASTVPIVAERAMYLNTTARQWEGGTASVGATSLSTTWSLAEGATGFFYTYLLLGNPNADAATVTVRYQLPDGTTIEKTHEVAGQSRRTIDVRAEDARLESATIGMSVNSTLPIVTERVMWWGLPFYEGSVALGSTATGSVWAIGEGWEAGPKNEATFVLVSNGSSTDGTVRLTVVYEDGESPRTEQKEYALAGNARLTERIGEHFPNALNRSFSVLVESLTDGVPITVEYSRYLNAGTNPLDGGGAALATRVR